MVPLKRINVHNFKCRLFSIIQGKWRYLLRYWSNKFFKSFIVNRALPFLYEKSLTWQPFNRIIFLIKFNQRCSLRMGGGVWDFNEYMPPWIMSYFQVCLYILDLLRSVAAHKIKFGFLCVLIGNSIQWKSINIRVKLLSKHTDLTYTWVISLSHRIGSIEPSLTRTGFWQAGTCRMKVLSAATFM